MASTASIVDRIDEIRKRRALAYAEQGKVLDTDEPRVFEVAGTDDHPYTVDLEAVSCTCPDHTIMGHICKHLGAAHVWFMALEKVDQLATAGGMTFSELAAKLKRQAAEITNNRDLAQKLHILERAARHLDDDHDRKELIVEYRTCNTGRNILHTDSGRLTEIIESDGFAREPRTPDAETARTWLTEHRYTRAITEWIDPERPLRRRREVFIR